MSRNYDNWERLVAAVIRREQIWELCHAQSRSPSICSESSDFTFPSPNPSTFEPSNSPEIHISAAAGSRSGGRHSKIYLEIKKRLKMRGLVEERPELSALKSLVPCWSVFERNLLADTARIIERKRIVPSKRENVLWTKIVVGDLTTLGYDASICISKWEKSPSFPAGEHEYVDVIIEGERLIVAIDFRSEFQITRPTKAYKMVLQTLPYVLVGKTDRLGSIIGIVSDATKQSLMKKGIHLPPWRKVDYMKAKWLSPFSRIGPAEGRSERD